MTTAEKLNALSETMPQFGRFTDKVLTPEQCGEIDKIYACYIENSFMEEEFVLNKKKLRADFKKKRDGLPSDVLDKYSKLATEKILNLQEYKDSMIVFIPISFGSEWSTSLLINQALKDFKRVVVPAVRGKNMLLQEITSQTSYHKAAFGILEPDDGKIIDEMPDFTLLPGLAFSPLGFRIGYGGGYYDRFLCRYNGISVGVCMPDFITSVIPQKWDYPADIMIFL